ncbi:MAG: LD-carboxypeptidase [Sporolactobacillus sp.]
MQIPDRLNEGDIIGVISPAGPADPEKTMRAASWLKSLGFQIRFGTHVFDRCGYLAGTDQDRLDDFHAMFADTEVKAIICARGGYGCARFAQSIDFGLIASHPKIFWGYSDVTYLHTAIRQKTGLVTFHGPMLASDMAEENVPTLSRQLFSQLFQPISLRYDTSISPLSTLSGGSASGSLVGGNLSLLVSSLGTPFELNTQHALLLIEDTNEAPYRIDGMLNQLKLSGKLDQAAGFIVGNFHYEDELNEDTGTFDELFAHYLLPLHKPVVSGFLIGHCQPHFAVPLGTEALLDADRKQLWIQPGVC